MNKVTVFRVLLIISLTLSCKNDGKMIDEIWNSELAYWNNLKNGNLVDYHEMLHENFSDWPASASNPIDNRLEMREFVSNTLDNFKTVDFKLDHSLTRMLDDNEAIVYFTCVVTGILKDGTSVNVRNRMVHIWRKSNGTFKLIGGLQAEPSK